MVHMIVTCSPQPSEAMPRAGTVQRSRGSRHVGINNSENTTQDLCLPAVCVCVRLRMGRREGRGIGSGIEEDTGENKRKSSKERVTESGERED